MYITTTFPACATSLVESADSFVIQRIKSERRALWNEKIMVIINLKMWADASCGSGRLVNPGKRYVLWLTADVVRNVGQLHDAHVVLLI